MEIELKLPLGVYSGLASKWAAAPVVAAEGVSVAPPSS